MAEKSPLSRRSFVKGAVYASAGFALGGYALQNAASMLKPSTHTVERYKGVLNVGGPAPRPLPLIPVDFEGGTIVGSTEHLEWLWYCGLNQFPGIRPGATDDDTFTFAEPPEGTDAWYGDLAGQAMRRRDFLDRAGEGPVGANGTWRKVGGQAIPVIVVHLGDRAPAEATDGFLATSGKCVHLCCVPGYNQSRQRFDHDADDRIYCTCHHSVYDPRVVVERTYLAERPPER